MPKASSIPIHTERNSTPIPLASRFGEWMDNAVLINNWHQNADGDVLQTLGLIASRFPTESDHITHPGDPRNFCDEEVGFVAMFKGRLGIHVELELNFALDEDNDPLVQAKDEELVPPDVFERRLMFWREKLASMDALFPHTEFFIAHGEMTYMGRVTINAFTPLSNGIVGDQTIARPDEFFMLSPYLPNQEIPSIFECATLTQVTNTLIEAGMHNNLTGAEAAQKAGNPSALSLDPQVIELHQRELNAYKIRINP
ncbi:hypothetical protein [Marinobacter salarius]|uniref:Uncharacterized protein n=1 Tax=Marinobacter salarius TaxID=1420917 RepID=A0A1W6KFD4_9GAMM|nr:hypothetical protein [Marinobacter salarius]ARM86144.1 hypothetical protein MARSALSMR5_04124 [Marinobacter salarius]